MHIAQSVMHNMPFDTQSSARKKAGKLNRLGVGR